MEYIYCHNVKWIKRHGLNTLVSTAMNYKCVDYAKKGLCYFHFIMK